MTREIRDLRRRDEGAVAVEAAISLSVLLLLILGTIEFAFAFWQWNTMLLAVNQVGRCVMIGNNPALNGSPANCGTGSPQAQLQTALNTTCTLATPSAGQTCVTASASPQNGTNGMTLTAAYGFDFIALTGSFKITSSTWVPLLD